MRDRRFGAALAGICSLLAFQVLARVAKEFKIELPRRVLFRGARMLAELEVASYVE